MLYFPNIRHPVVLSNHEAIFKFTQDHWQCHRLIGRMIAYLAFHSHLGLLFPTYWLKVVLIFSTSPVFNAFIEVEDDPWNFAEIFNAINCYFY